MNKIFNEDAVEGMKERLEDESVDLILSDVPYKISSGGNSDKTKNKMGGIMSRSNSDKLKNGDLFEHNAIKFSDFLPEMYRILKEGGHCYLFINGRNMQDLLNEAEKSKFKLLNVLVWVKNTATPNRWFMQGCEFILMFRKGKAVPIHNKGTKNVLEFPNIRNKLHPTQKPVELLKVLIENSSKEGDLICDPFMGSGSTAISCLETGRKFVGWELDKQYFDIGEKRIKEWHENNRLGEC